MRLLRVGGVAIRHAGGMRFQPMHVAGDFNAHEIRLKKRCRHDGRVHRRRGRIVHLHARALRQVDFDPVRVRGEQDRRGIQQRDLAERVGADDDRGPVQLRRVAVEIVRAGGQRRGQRAGGGRFRDIHTRGPGVVTAARSAARSACNSARRRGGVGGPGVGDTRRIRRRHGERGIEEGLIELRGQRIHHRAG